MCVCVSLLDYSKHLNLNNIFIYFIFDILRYILLNVFGAAYYDYDVMYFPFIFDFKHRSMM